MPLAIDLFTGDRQIRAASWHPFLCHCFRICRSKLDRQVHVCDLFFNCMPMQVLCHVCVCVCVYLHVLVCMCVYVCVYLHVHVSGGSSIALGGAAAPPPFILNAAPVMKLPPPLPPPPPHSVRAHFLPYVTHAHLESTPFVSVCVCGGGGGAAIS